MVDRLKQAEHVEKKEQEKRNGEHKRNKYKHLQSYRRFSFLNSPATMFSCIYFPPIYTSSFYFFLTVLFPTFLTIRKRIDG